MVEEIILDYLHLALLGDVLGGLDVLEDLDGLAVEAGGLKCANCRSSSLLVGPGLYTKGVNVWNLDQDQLPAFIQEAVEQVIRNPL